jgi:hypothetical protein
VIDDALPPKCPYCDWFVTWPIGPVEDIGILWGCVVCERKFLQLIGLLPQVLITFDQNTDQPGE